MSPYFIVAVSTDAACYSTGQTTQSVAHGVGCVLSAGRYRAVAVAGFPDAHHHADGGDS